MLNKGTLVILAAACSLAVGLIWLCWPESQPKDLPEQMRLLSHSLDSRQLKTQQWDLSDYALFLDANGNPQSRISIMVQARYRDIKNRVKLYASLPEAEGLEALLDQSIVGMLVGGQYPTFELNLINTYSASTTIEEMSRRLKVIYFGSDQWKRALSQKGTGLAEYNTEVDALFVPCLEFASPIIKDALVLHELKHAQQYRQMKAFGIVRTDTAGKISDLTADQEVQAHHLGGRILNVGTNGEYQHWLKVVIARHPASSAISLLMAIRKGDVVYLDELFGQAGPIESAMRRYGYFFDLGEAWIEHNISQEGRAPARRELYKQLFYSQPN